MWQLKKNVAYKKITTYFENQNLITITVLLKKGFAGGVLVMYENCSQKENVFKEIRFQKISIDFEL